MDEVFNRMYLMFVEVFFFDGCLEIIGIFILGLYFFLFLKRLY